MRGLPFCGGRRSRRCVRSRSSLEPLTSVPTPDAFDQFADECGLRMTAEPLCVAPRDVLAPLEGLDQHFLVSLSRLGVIEATVRLVFLTPVTSRSGPSIRDVLWWMAGDAWVLERADGDINAWAATYGYPSTDEPTVWLFDQASRQSKDLERLLGGADMKRLLALYETEMGPSRTS